MIEDNGIGRYKAKQIKANSNIKHNSKGLKMISERLNHLNLQFNTNNYSLSVENAFKNKENTGTKTTILFLKLNQNSEFLK